MEQILALKSKNIQIKIENFEGPLDLLCHLIDKNKMDIYQINLDEIADQYLEYMQKMQEQKLAIGSEFIVMASALLLIKSKGLLPKIANEEEEELTEEELIRRIVEYKKYKEITAKLKELYNIYSELIYRNPEKIKLPKQELETNYQKQSLINIYQDLIEKMQSRKNINAQNIEKIAIKDTYTVGSKVKEIFRELLKKPKFIFNKKYTLAKCDKIEVVTAFTGLLELSRRSKVKTAQNETFGDITVERIKKQKIE